MADASEGGAHVPQKGDFFAGGQDFEVYHTVSGAFELFRLHGKCTGGLLTLLRDRLFRQTCNMALDTAGLSDGGYPLARELILGGRRFRNSGKNLVLVNARGTFRDLIRTGASENLIHFVISERMLEGDLPQFLKRIQDVRRQVGLIRSEIENNPAWQLVDREMVWLCPYCARMQDHLRINPRQIVPEALIEGIWLHLTEECSEYRSGRTIRGMPELSDVLRRANQEKMSVSRTTATALATRVIELQGKVQEVEESVQVAAERQRRLLPSRTPAIPGVVSGLGYWPANRVSGDFYDFLELGSNRFAMLIGDVTGHGIEAAVLMGVAKKVVSIRTRDTGDPALALQMANRDIYPDLDRRTFVSVFLGIMDAESREFTYVRAGHNPVILFNPARSPQFAKLEAPGLVLGLDSGSRFNTVMVRETVPLQSGDTLFFYTDGMVEAANRAGEDFGLHRVYERLRRTDLAPQEIVEGLHKDVAAFSEGLPQEDDVTAFLFRFEG